MDTQQYINKYWNSGATVKQAAHHLASKGISPSEVVTKFRALARQFGYSSPIPETPPERPYATDWVKCRNDLEFSKELGLYWNGALARDVQSAEYAGWVGAGSTLRNLIKQRRLEV